MIILFKRLWPYITNYKTSIFFAMSCSLPLAAIKGYQTYLVKPIFDKGLGANATSDDALKLGLTILALALINYPFRFFHFYLMKMAANYFIADIRNDLYKKYQSISVSYFAKNKTGNMISKVVSDSFILNVAFNHSLDIVREPITAICLLGVAFYHDWKLALFTFLILPLFLLVFKLSGKLIRRYTERFQEEFAEMTHDLTEGLMGQKIIKAFNLQNFIQNRFKSSQSRYLTSVRKFVMVEEHAHPIVESIGALMFFIIIYVAHKRISAGHLTTGGFVSFIAAIAMLMDPIRKFSAANIKMSQARAAADRVFSVLDEDDEPDIGSEELKEFKDAIEFNNLTFSYGEGDVVKNFSLKVKKGERVALVGLSGSGKSTLVNLLLRLYDTKPGEITIDGQDVHKFSLKSYRALFALVSQDIFLFNDSVRANLLCGEQRSEEEINHAIEVSYSKEFIDKLPQGMETVIGDRGTKLSGGQCQRLTIARAFLSHSPIYLFDEATSALDNESEKIVQAALDRVAGDKTVIAIAHRLSTVQDYDRIVVMKDGEQIEMGSHHELMANNGEYKKLYELSQKS